MRFRVSFKSPRRSEYAIASEQSIDKRLLRRSMHTLVALAERSAQSKGPSVSSGPVMAAGNPRPRYAKGFEDPARTRTVLEMPLGTQVGADMDVLNTRVGYW